MANIQGRYNLRAALFIGGDPSSRDIYTFANNNRNGSISFSADCDLDFQQLDPARPANHGSGRCFICQNKLFIKRARVITPGAPGVQPGLGALAANLLLSTYAIDPDNNRQPGAGAWLLRLDNYNEWVECNADFSSFDLADYSDHYYFQIKGQASSYLTVDDYNLQKAYEGQPLRAFLELDIDTAGLLSTTDFSLV